ncbi:MAG TPA: chromosome segregation protein SMC [Rhizomicrobium sp.]
MKFDRLRISGFKSFVEPTELLIEPGLTAVVGPNGCGKSNLFDALRWVMGETRPTSVRGTEMDDVIFAGSSGRPSRNQAEVILHVDNSDRKASPQFNDYDTIEISRRIEREAGSVYRINGRDVRQRDVQLFFADAASGAGSTAFVRQGQIGLLISQKPLARRAILEEAAGISGLHQRRHEAELRLRAAETNMSRIDDVIREVEAGLQNLKRQARQASRYRNLSGHIRKAEALALHLRWLAAEAQAKHAEEALAAANDAVAVCTDQAAQASTIQVDAAAAVPPLRQREAERAAALHRLTVEREALDAEEARAREEAQRMRQRIGQTEQDIAREKTLDADASAALEKLSAEATELEAAQARAKDDLEAAQARAIELADALREREQTLERLNAELAEWNARKNGLDRQREVAAALVETSGAQLSEAQSRLDQATEGAANSPDARAAEAATEAARTAAEELRTAFEAARAALEQAEATEGEARKPLQDIERRVQELSAEARALSNLLRPQGDDLFPPLVDAVKVQPGYEAAFAAALGDDLQSPLDEASPHHWRNLGALTDAPALPDGVQPLSKFVEAPEALARRLSMTGVVFHDQGSKLQAELKPGQRLVSARGDVWRWDGYSASAEAQSQAAMRLAQRNRLADLETEIAKAKEQQSEIFATYSAARDATQAAREASRAADQKQSEASRALIAAQDEAAKAARAAAERMSRLASLEAEIRRLTQTRDTAVAAEKEASDALAALADGAALAQAVAQARSDAADARGADAESRGAVEGLTRAGAMRTLRLGTIAEEKSRWETRRAAATAQIEELDRRLAAMNEELVTLEAVPQMLADKRGALLDAIGTAEAARREAADLHAEAEQVLAAADKALKAAEAAASTAREERARSQALSESAAERIDELRTRIRDELDLSPEGLAAEAELKDGEDLPSIEYADKRVEKLKAERESLGGVNLRAEEEAHEQETRLTGLTTDRDDLAGAIDRLRRGISSLNKEGRERLIESYAKVNENFQMLFTKLFEGGEAKLTLTESEDPLEAGLEIFARPPGKRLQNLTLLSGGEQALTAMALIFAVFLVNPAPVCVLDEVDAPLDDANVERFCNLLDEMTRITDTRFLVITHHALTMSRMHRLFGVTMAERGVSQLVSVKLAEATQIAAAE